MDKFGNITRFKIHDLVHDLAQSIMEEECHCIKDDAGATNLSVRTRHLSFYGSEGFFGRDSIHLQQVKSSKTYFTGIQYDDHLTLNDLLKCHSLRVLSLMSQGMLSSSIGHLKHLRSLFILAPEMGELTSLRTLNIYIVLDKKGFLLEELGSLNLKGELYIKHLERVTSVMDAKEANLAAKNLNDFGLSWERNEGSRSQKNVEQILEELQPHAQLKTLIVTGYMGVQFPK
ncbi:putative disease resistance protein RGA4 isoform X1 [Prosopis cineraria]|uniref:putative disease resistance protein RGA4 isoform X1 n=1 Tax=Prosopis cineraria TaxID=364024 RepID=UPI00240F7924|nr:putative disease resistance protein RGA4 isoform X1 [Prosopis cineraria]